MGYASFGKDASQPTGTYLAGIDYEAVTTALESLRQARPLGQNHPLRRLVSWQAAGIPIVSDAQVYLELVRRIRHHLKRQRRQYGLWRAERRLAEAESLALLREDFRQANPELEAWSVLYHRYVRVDLGLSISQLSEQVNQTPRSLHRRQQRGIIRLTTAIVGQELQFYRTRREAVLRACLPSPLPPHLVGREALLAAILNHLTADIPRHCLLYGLPGVGKSSLALAAAHRLIRESSLQQILWLDRPVPSEVLHAVEFGLGKVGFWLSLLLQTEDTLVVLDDAEAILADVQYFRKVCNRLGAARVIWCTTRLPVTLSGIPCVLIPPFDAVAPILPVGEDTVSPRGGGVIRV